jgi:hypothetical protein
MPEPAQSEPAVDVRTFAWAVRESVMRGHYRRHEWVAECVCGERWPCLAQKAWMSGVKAMFAALDELDALRTLAGDVGRHPNAAP